MADTGSPAKRQQADLGGQGPRDTKVSFLALARLSALGSRPLAVAHGRRLASELKIVGAILEQPVIEKILPLMAVYLYAEPVATPGFVFMDSPGFDLVSATGQIAGGANLIAFTGCRGSKFGSKPAPCVKLATNTPMRERLADDLGINFGLIMHGTASMDQMGQCVFELFLRVASRERSKSGLLSLGDHEFLSRQNGIMS